MEGARRTGGREGDEEEEENTCLKSSNSTEGVGNYVSLHHIVLSISLSNFEFVIKNMQLFDRHKKWGTNPNFKKDVKNIFGHKSQKARPTTRLTCKSHWAGASKNDNSHENGVRSSE